MQVVHLDDTESPFELVYQFFVSFGGVILLPNELDLPLVELVVKIQSKEEPDDARYGAVEATKMRQLAHHCPKIKRHSNHRDSLEVGLAFVEPDEGIGLLLDSGLECPVAVDFVVVAASDVDVVLKEHVSLHHVGQ